MSEIFQKIRLLRKNRGLTLSDVADKIGTDHQHISRIERGKSKLTVDFLMKLANALDTPIEELMDEAPAPKTPEPMQSDLLGVILENIEELAEHSQKKLTAKQKAAMATSIYQQSFKASTAQDPDLVQTIFINCATELIKEILN